MELSQLKALLEVAQRQNITQTANYLHITQPALSKIILRLENELDIQLFDRNGKRIVLNENGTVVCRYAQKIFSIISDMYAELDERKNERIGQLRIGSSYPANDPSFISTALTRFSAKLPDVTVVLHQITQSSLQDVLLNRNIDLAIVTAPIRSLDIQFEELFTEKIGVILSINHPLAKYESLSLKDLCGERFITNGANESLQELTTALCQMVGFKPNIYIECDYPSFIGWSISLSHGISLISEDGYQRSIQKKDREPWESAITFRPIREHFSRRVCGIAYLADRHLPNYIQIFKSILIEASHQIET
ncbi:MAG: LysR family transcriptional regulator [Oscillospiraceae bacterium]|nr:LysR family transcriptional regulator [Oscillospiraceae bacterium]